MPPDVSWLLLGEAWALASLLWRLGRLAWTALMWGPPAMGQQPAHNRPGRGRKRPRLEQSLVGDVT